MKKGGTGIKMVKGEVFWLEDKKSQMPEAIESLTQSLIPGMH